MSTLVASYASKTFRFRDVFGKIIGSRLEAGDERDTAQDKLRKKSNHAETTVAPYYFQAEQRERAGNRAGNTLSEQSPVRASQRLPLLRFHYAFTDEIVHGTIREADERVNSEDIQGKNCELAAQGRQG